MIKTCLQKTSHAIAAVVRTFENKKKVTTSLLVLCFLTSFATTYSGFIALVGGWKEITVFSLFLTFTFTAVIQFTVIWFAKKWWETRNVIWIFSFSFCVLLSVSMALACYFDILSLDKLHAGNIYVEKLEGTLGAVTASAQRYQVLANKTQELAKHSTAMVQEEQRFGKTCDVVEVGRGPRALYRENDQQEFKYYENVFNKKNEKISNIHETIIRDFKQYDSSKIILLNALVHDFNAVATDNGDLVQLKARLKKRTNAKGEWFNTGVRFGKVFIKCPDPKIKQYRNYVSSISFEKIPTIKITDPDTPGTQVIQAFDIMLNLLTLRWKKISEEQWIALVFAIGIDLVIFLLAYTLPNTAVPSTPATGSSWRNYWQRFENHEDQSLPVLRRLFQYASYKKMVVHFFIPTHESVLIKSILPLISTGMARHRRTIRQWQTPFYVPIHIRELIPSGCSFEHYQVSVHVVAQWFGDQQRSNESRVGEVPKGYPGTNSSLNGNSHRDFMYDPAKNKGMPGHDGTQP